MGTWAMICPEMCMAHLQFCVSLTSLGTEIYHFTYIPVCLNLAKPHALSDLPSPMGMPLTLHKQEHFYSMCVNLVKTVPFFLYYHLSLVGEGSQ